MFLAKHHSNLDLRILFFARPFLNIASAIAKCRPVVYWILIWKTGRDEYCEFLFLTEFQNNFSRVDKWKNLPKFNKVCLSMGYDLEIKAKIPVEVPYHICIICRDKVVISSKTNKFFCK